MGASSLFGALFSGKGRQIAKATPMGFAANEIYKNVGEIRDPIKKAKRNFDDFRKGPNTGTQKGSLLTPVSNQSKSILGA